MIDFDEEALKEVFLNNPLREVAFEIRFPMNLRVMCGIYEVQELLKDDYPEVSREETKSLDTPTEITYVFSNPERSRTVRVGEDRFAVSFTRYESFEEFKAQALGYSKRFCNMHNIEQLNRVGLRYINNIPIPIEGNNVSLNRYVTPYLNDTLVQSNLLNRFAVQLVMRIDDFLLQVHSGLVIEPEMLNQGNVVYILDLDAFIGKTKAEELSGLLDRFHHRVQIEFLSHITEEYKEQMRRQKCL